MLTRRHARLAFSVLHLLAFVLIVSCLFAIAMPLYRLRLEGKQSSREGCMAKIRRALLAYHHENGHFPPAYLVDADGHPMHSWRVLLLPYMNHDDLYRAYNFAEPWNGPNNIKLLSATPMAYGCGDVDSPYCSFLVVTGQHTAFPGDSVVSIDEIRDARESTALLVDWPESDVLWLEPRDLRFEELFDDVTAGRGNAISWVCQERAVLCADYLTRTVSAGAPRKGVRALFTISGGDSSDASTAVECHSAR